MRARIVFGIILSITLGCAMAPYIQTVVSIILAFMIVFGGMYWMGAFRNGPPSV